MPSEYVEHHAWGVELRSIRANRPKLAQTGARARTFGAALEQAEQLWRASETVGPIVSPLLLFYGLTQAGRAICAAGGPDPGWRPAEKHGLAFQFTRPASGTTVDLAAVVVEPCGDGLIQQVARVLDSEVLSGPATLSALLGSLDMKLLFSESQVPDPKPLEAHQRWITPFPSATDATKTLFLAPTPERFAAKTELVPAGPQNLEHTRIIPPTGEEIAEWLRVYPTLRDLGIPTEVIGPEPAGGRFGRDDWIIKLVWDGGAPMADVKQSDWTLEHLDEPYSVEWNGTHGVVLPAVAGNTKAYDLVVAWWLVLYCLSMLARYYPQEWTEMLDVDRSALAVPIEHFMSIAYSRVPELIAFRLRMLRVIQDRP